MSVERNDAMARSMVCLMASNIASEMKVEAGLYEDANNRRIARAAVDVALLIVEEIDRRMAEDGS